eukprot:gene4910-biopygen3985
MRRILGIVGSVVSSEEGSQESQEEIWKKTYTRVKLPKLEIRKFSSKIQEWNEFWDSLKSAVHENPSLAKVDKFKYLRSFLDETVWRTISGLTLLDKDYDAAVDILERRYAKPMQIKRAHINDIINLAPIFNDRSLTRLRNLHDDLETHFHGLEAMGAEKETHSSVVIPVVMEKIPESIRNSMIRFGGDYLNWNLDELLKALAKELEIREIHVPLKMNGQQQLTSQNNQRPRQNENMGTTSALFMGKQEKKRCPFCLQDHEAEACEKYKNPEDQPQPLSKREMVDVNKNVHKLWDLDSGIRVDDEVHENVIDDMTFDGQRYSVGLPWKTGYGQIPCNYNNALIRLKGQLKKLSKKPGILQKYEDIIKKQVELGIIERVSETNLNKKVSYLPHQPVVRENAETTKVIIVYDASCKDRETKASLNNCLHVGPPLTPMIFDILIRFREQPVVLVGDIEKAFLNIEVHPVDRDCVRFLWVANVQDQSPEVIEYRFNRVVFGVSSSPFLWNAVIRHHVDKYKENDPSFSEQKIGWDDPIPADKSKVWQEWIKSMKQANTITTPRAVLNQVKGKVLRTSLHGFGDASKKAYCAAIYLVYETAEGIYSGLLCSKSRIAPLKGLSIPRIVGSRGPVAEQLKDNQLWWEGPSWLKENRDKWPSIFMVDESNDVIEERKKIVATIMVAVKSKNGISDIKRFSSLKKLFKVTAYVRKFIYNLKQKVAKKDFDTIKLRVKEIKEAEREWIIDAQLFLQDNKDFAIYKDQLGIVKKDGILICKGRFEYADLEFDAKNPIILPKSHEFADLVIMDCHVKREEMLAQGIGKKLIHFWNRWKREHLVSLREHHRMNKKPSNAIGKGDVVLMQDDNKKRIEWKLGLVEELIAGKDGEVRGVSIRVSNKGNTQNLYRPVQKVYPLEISDAAKPHDYTKSNAEENVEGKERTIEVSGKMNKVNENGDESELRNTSSELVRSRRAAAKDARCINRLLLGP